jgi:two-component system, NarL family, response regulator DevR
VLDELSLRGEQLDCLGRTLAHRTSEGILSPKPAIRPGICGDGVGSGAVVHNDAMTATPSDTGIIRVFLMDDHEIVRRGLADLIGLERDMEVVGEAGSTADALHRIPAARPDVAVLDVRLPDGSGVEVCREVRSSMPDVHCLMLTSYADDEALFDAIMAGASGYVLKEIRGNDLIDAIRQVAGGKSLLDPMATQRVLERLRNGEKHDTRLDALSDQEKRILELIGEGLTNRQIGEQMHLAEKTVKNYVSSLLAKLGMERRTQAAAYVARMSVENEHR